MTYSYPCILTLFHFRLPAWDSLLQVLRVVVLRGTVEILTEHPSKLLQKEIQTHVQRNGLNKGRGQHSQMSIVIFHVMTF